MPKLTKFPKDFIWGSATAAYQIEGGVKEGGRGESIWDRFSHTKGKTRNGHTGDIACDSYHRYKEDVSLLKDLGVNAYRFSIAWPRIFPAGTGKVNQKGMDYYDRLIDLLLKNKITPFVTMYHWDLPQALEDKGGWRNKDTSYAFGDYAKMLVKHYSDRVKNWITLNEMPCSANIGYEDGGHAPGAKESRKVVNQVIHNHMLAHGLGMQAVKFYAEPGCEAGLTHLSAWGPKDPENKKDIAAARKAFFDWHWSGAWWYGPLMNGEYYPDLWKKEGKDVPNISDDEMRIISTPMDFLGLNIYFAHLFEHADDRKGWKEHNYSEYQKTDMNWAVIRDSLYYGVKLISDLYVDKVKKFYITENGAGYADAVMRDGKVHDPERSEYIRQYLGGLHRAIKEGYNIKGYFYWSLLDNFEWSLGYQRRFGIVYTDFHTLKRIPKDSYYYYKSVIKKNGVMV